MAVPEHVLRAFQLDGEGELVPQGTRFGHVVVAPAGPAAAWSAKVCERLTVRGVDVARPVRATDGRFVVGGYCASAFAPGVPAARVDAAVAAALQLDEALVGVRPPSSEGRAADAERVVFEGVALAGERVVAHTSLLSSLLFDGASAPVITHLDPSAAARPRGFTAALVIVDGLCASAVDRKVLDRWSHVPHLEALVEVASALREVAVDKKECSNPVRGVSSPHGSI